MFLLILEIGLTIGAWVRGWKGWALLPLGIGLGGSFLFGLIFSGSPDIVSGFVDSPLSIVLDVIVVIVLIVMVAKGRKKKEESFDPQFQPSQRPPVSQINTSIVPPAVVNPYAKLIMPDKSEIPVTGAAMPFGRSDFDKHVDPTYLGVISRQHLSIKTEFGKYYLKDTDSSNGTRLNGFEIKGVGWQELKDGDRIDVAGAANLTFKMG